MKKDKEFVSGLSSTLFWDTDIKKINPIKHAPYIVDRVLQRGTMEDFNLLKEYYGKEKVGEIAKSLRYMDNRVLHFCSAYFNIPIKHFRCYSYKLMTNFNWDY